MKSLDYLFELIKLDMQQIQNYRVEIIYVSVTMVVASFAFSAFIHKDNKLDHRIKSLLLLLSNSFLFGILIVTTRFYYEGLDGSRAALELRENALKQHVDRNDWQVKANELYPETCGYPLKMKSWLEKFPMFLAMAAIVIKTMIEWIVLRARYKKRTHPDAGGFSVDT